MIRRRALPSLAVTLALLAWVGWPVLGAPWRRQLGAGCTEAPKHLWGLWTTTRGLWGQGPLHRVADVGFPDGFESHLMDPVNLLVFAPVYWLMGGGAAGASLAWNALALGAIAIAAWGSWLLGRELVEGEPGERWAIALLVAAFAGNAYLVGFPAMGRTELLPAVLLPWHLALLHRFVRGGSWRSGVGAGLLLGGVALGGAYLAVFTALVEVPLALAVAWGQPWRRALPRLTVVAVLVLLVTAPLAWTIASHMQDEVLGRSVDGVVEFRHQVHMPARLFFRLGEPVGPTSMEQPAYAGAVVLLLGLVGAVGRPRGALPWLATGALAAVLSLGPGLGAGAQPDVRLPVWWLLGAAPPLQMIRSWPRMGALVPLPFGVAAAYGVLVLARRWRSRWWAPALLVLALVDQATWPRHPGVYTMESGAPDDVLTTIAALPEGAILHLPLDHTRVAPCRWQGRYLLWQMEHGRPVTQTDTREADTALRYSAIARTAAQIQQHALRDERKRIGHRSVPAQQAECLRADAHALAGMGFGGIVLDTRRSSADTLRDILEGALGEPDRVSERVLAWDVTRFGDAGEPCALPRRPWQ